MLDNGPGEVAKSYVDFQTRAMNTSPVWVRGWHWIQIQEGRFRKILQHLNELEKGVIEITKEEREGDMLPVSIWNKLLIGRGRGWVYGAV